jgi:hypothetical protein
MATTSQYLQSLQNDMQTLKTNVANKGVAVDGNDNFTTLSAKVSQISGGGEEPTFTGMEDIIEFANSFFSKIDVALNKQVEQREVYTNNAITLYTPNSSCQHYVISQRTDGYYRVIWFEAPYGRKLYSSGTFCPCGCDYSRIIYVSGDNFGNLSMTSSLSSGGNSGIAYCSSNYSSVQECIDAIQSNSTAYTQYTNTSYNASGNNAIIYSNVSAFDYSVSGQNDDFNLITTVKKLSKNETIVQI